jgi:hypothetical protein
VLWEQKSKEKRESRVPRTLTGSILIAWHHSDLMNLNLQNSRRKTPVHTDPPLRQLLCSNHLLIGTQNSNNRRQNWTRARKIAASTTDCSNWNKRKLGKTNQGRRREEKKKGGKKAMKAEEVRDEI